MALVHFKNDSARYTDTKSEHIEYLNSLADSIESYKASIVDPVTDPMTPKTVWMVKSFIQLTIHRVVDLFTVAVNCWDNGQLAITFILARAIAENAAAIFDLYLSLDSSLQKGDLNEIHNAIVVRLFGGRNELSLVRVSNIMTAVDKVDKLYEGFKVAYEDLSEFAHPNYSGMHGLYGKMDHERLILYIDGSARINDLSLGMLLFPLTESLRITNDAITFINAQYPAIWLLSDEDRQAKESAAKPGAHACQ